MKILQINTVYKKGSTGKIAAQIQEICEKEGLNARVAYRFSEDESYNNTMIVSSWLDCHVHNRLANMFNLTGKFSFFHTLIFLDKVKKWNPDIVHLHNLHGNYINIKLLFNFLSKNKIKTIWTLHDCWAFTGGCAYFDNAKCEKWKNGCQNCGTINENSGKCYRHTNSNLIQKQKLIKSVDGLLLVTPSVWLKALVENSSLSGISTRVINNGIDLGIFRPVESNFKAENDIKKYMVLGLANVWEKRKGLETIINLRKMLGDEYTFVLVGITDDMANTLPDGIISINRTANQEELVKIYSAADVFINPTREDNFPTVNIEALACGTPVITHNVGGSAEIIDSKSGISIELDDINGFKEAIVTICTEKPFTEEACVSRAKLYNNRDKFMEYVDLYQRVYMNEE